MSSEAASLLLTSNQISPALTDASGPSSEGSLVSFQLSTASAQFRRKILVIGNDYPKLSSFDLREFSASLWFP